MPRRRTVTSSAPVSGVRLAVRCPCTWTVRRLPGVRSGRRSWTGLRARATI
jgi:hypothetical protein